MSLFLSGWIEEVRSGEIQCSSASDVPM